MEVYSDDESPKAKTIHVIMRPEKDGEVVKISEIEKKNMKKQLKNVFEDFPEDEESFGDTKASQLAAANQKPKKEKKDKKIDEEE